MSKIVLLSVVLLLEGVWQVRGHRTFQPCGPKLCETFYQRYKKCLAKIFDEIQLSCQLTMKIPTMNRSCLISQEADVGAVGASAMESNQRKNISNSQDPAVKPDEDRREPAKTLAQGAHQLPCEKEPIYFNQGAVRKRKFSRPGYPVVIEYECDKTAEEKYKYFSGPREALCDNKGNWIFPAMICMPTGCYTIITDSIGKESPLYVGDTHHDKEGIECQVWIEDKPHKTYSTFRMRGVCSGCRSLEDVGNKCRAIHYESKPWCYTMDPKVRWNFCDIPECKTERSCARPPNLSYAPAVRTELFEQKVHVTYRCHKDLTYMGGKNLSICDMKTGVWEWPYLLCASEKCFYFDRDQWRKAVYVGNISTTKTGRTCQRWDSQTPHKHHFNASNVPAARTLSGLGNACRDPHDRKMPWCFTTDPGKRWEFCPVPECALQP